MAQDPVYFELSWSILSTIGAANVFFGLLVVDITSHPLIAAVPLITSAATATANGLCYYAFYLTSSPAPNRAVASAFADVLWLVQEAGLSFYSYLILSRILRGTQWRIFASLFWVIILALVGVRIGIAITRVKDVLGGRNDLQGTVDRLHMAYFPLIAVLECVSAYYLLKTFTEAKMNAMKRASTSGVFQYLIRSTEVRLALLAAVGIMRAVTYSFQQESQGATNTASQVDRFAYTLECLFPVIMYIDMLASKIISSSHRQNISPPSSRQGPRRFVTGGNDDVLCSTHETEHVIEIQGGTPEPGHGRRDSQEHIIGRKSSACFGTEASDETEMDTMDPGHVGISKTVEIRVEVSESRNRNRSTSPPSE